MVRTKDLFMMMRQEELHTDNFLPTKKEIQKSSEEFSEKIIHSGEYNLQELLAQAIRYKEAITIVEKKIRDSIPQEDFEAFGLKAKYTDGGDIPQFEDDEIYRTLKKDLKDREELLKTALKMKDSFFDPYGNEIPKVSTKPRKSSLRITF